jgi:hypothetical protein
MSVLRASLLIAVALLVAGCGSDNGSSDEAADTGTTTACSLPGAAFTAQTGPAPASVEATYLTNVSMEAEECTDKVVFDFEDAVPGYRVSYQPGSTAKIEDGSGNPIAIAGADFLVVKLMPAMTAKIEGEDVTPTYTGPKSINPPRDVELIREVAKTGDFENVVTWVIGVATKHPYTVTTSDSQLVVELVG